MTSDTKLVRCPLCGDDKGYKLFQGSTFRWWSVSCAGCGQEVTECRAAFGSTQHTPAGRTLPADAAWNAAGAYADRLRAAINRACAGYPDNEFAPTCVAILREALMPNVNLGLTIGETPSAK